MASVCTVELGQDWVRALRHEERCLCAMKCTLEDGCGHERQGRLRNQLGLEKHIYAEESETERKESLPGQLLRSDCSLWIGRQQWYQCDSWLGGV